MQNKNIKILPVNLKEIPHELKQIPQWVGWKADMKEDGKFSKIPKDPKTGKNASTTDPKTWSTYFQAMDYYRRNRKNINGIGFVFTKEDPYCGIDFDDCIDLETGQIIEHCKDQLKYLNSYSEKSPSNTGIKTIAKAKLPGFGRKFKNDNSNIEIYDHARFFTITGNILKITSANIEERSEVIKKIYTKLSFSNDAKKHLVDEPWKGNINKLPIALGTKKLIKEGEKIGHRSEAIMSVVNSLVRSNVPEHTIFSIFNEYPIGEKYREKGASRHTWLKKHIQKAYSYLSHQDDYIIEAHLEFPKNVMSGIAGDFAKTYGSYLESPDHFFYMSFLTLLGLSVADCLHLDTHRKPQPRLYTILLGESANARKSTAIDETLKFFQNHLNNEQFEICKGAASGEGIAKLIQNYSKVLLVYDELNIFVSKAKIKNSTLLSATNILFESNQYTNQTSQNPIIVENGFVATLAASTKDTFYDLFDKNFTNIGFINRLFLVFGDSKKCFSVPETIPDQKIDKIINRITNCIKFILENQVIKMDKEAYEIWNNYYMSLKNNSPHSKRLDAYGLRLMPLLAVNDMKSVVDVEIVEKVIALLDWELKVRKIYDPIDAEGKIARMEEKIRRALQERKQWTKRDLQRKVNYSSYGIWAWETAIKNLITNEEITFGKKSNTYTRI